MPGLEHATLTAEALHVPGYLQNSDPGAVGAGKQWTDTSQGTGRWITKVRNETNTDWETVSAGATLPASGPLRITVDGRMFLQWRTADGGDGKFYELKFISDPVTGERLFTQSEEGVSTVTAAASLPASGATRITSEGLLFLQWQVADGGDDLFYEIKFYSDPVTGERIFGFGETGEA